MKYLGGKFRVGRKLAVHIAEHYEKNKERLTGYLEPFIGGGHSLIWNSKFLPIELPIVASDFNEDLIHIYQADPNLLPETTSEEEYREAMKDPIPSLKRGWRLFAASYAGKYRGGFGRAPNRKVQPTEEAKRAMFKHHKALEGRNITYKFCSYWDYQPKDQLIYCDPPYRNVTKYPGIGKFDSDRFDLTMREWSKDNIVLVSEYFMPDDFECIASYTTGTSMEVTGPWKDRVEKLFIHKSLIK